MSREIRVTLDKIKTEKVDPFLGRDQIIETQLIPGPTSYQSMIASFKVTFLYEYKADRLAVTVDVLDHSGHVIKDIPQYKTIGARPTFDRVCKWLTIGE